MTLHDAHSDAQALVEVDAWLAQFPNGVLAPEARALRVLLLCGLSRRDEAVDEFRRLQKVASGSPAVLRLRDSCVKE